MDEKFMPAAGATTVEAPSVENIIVDAPVVEMHTADPINEYVKPEIATIEPEIAAAEPQTAISEPSANSAITHGFDDSTFFRQDNGPDPTFNQGAPYNQGPGLKSGMTSSQGAPVNQGMPYNQGAPVNQGMPYNQGAPVNQGMPYSQGAPVNQGMPYNQGAPVNQGMPYNQGAPVNQGMPYNQANSYGYNPGMSGQYTGNRTDYGYDYGYNKDLNEYGESGFLPAGEYSDDPFSTYYYDDPYRVQAQQSNGKAVGALVCGIISLTMSLAFIGWIPGIVAIVLGSAGMKECRNKGMAKAGFILGIFGVVVGVIYTFGRILTDCL